MKKSYIFPSVFEHNNADLSLVSQDLINGLRLYIDDTAYVVGNLALYEGYSPHRTINASPNEIDYNILVKSSLLLATYKNNRPLVLTTGFPFTSYNVNKAIAKELIQRNHSIEFDMSTFSSKGKNELNVEVLNVEVIPEMLGNIIALRKGETNATGNFFVVSLGYGTCETVLSTENGIVQRTASSLNGLYYAVDLFAKELSLKYYLGLKNEKQIEVAFMNNYIILDRKKIDILDIRRRALMMYYKDVISPGLRKVFTDADFSKANKMYITGGGALFLELVENFYNEFDSFINIEVVDNPLNLTSTGYLLHSMQVNGGDAKTAVGIDVGNSNTVVTQFEDVNIETGDIRFK